MLKKFVCIVCPNGCEISAETEDGKITKIEGATCKRGEEYAMNEITNPMRTIATSILVENGDLPLAAVRLDRPVSKDKIFDVVAEIRKVTLQAPVRIGDVVLENICGCDCKVVAVKNIDTI